MSEYIGITIGPIGDTLELASKPVQLWGGSAMFSYIMEQLWRALKPDFEENIIFPCVPAAMEGKRYNAGLFPDHMVLCAEERNFNRVLVIISQVKKTAIFNLSGMADKVDEKKAASDFLTKYLQIYAIDVNLESGTFGKKIMEVSHLLDKTELMHSISPMQISNETDRRKTPHPILSMFKNDTMRRGMLMNKLCTDKDEENPLLTKNKDDGSYRFRDIKELINSDKSNIKKPSYYAVVQADGDNMGNLLEHTDDEKAMRNISSRCFEYGKSAVSIVTDAGGIPIYAGGDDLLFLAPAGDVIAVCNELSNKFNEIFECERKLMTQKPPALSFGVSVNFEKYPLYEAFADALSLLSVSKKKESKNTLSLRVRKHSGSSFGFAVRLCDSEAFDKIDEIINNYAVKKNKESSKKPLSSVVYKLEEQNTLLCAAMKAEEDAPIENFTENILFDGVHKGDDFVRQFIDDVKELLLKIKKSNGTITAVLPEKKIDEENGGPERSAQKAAAASAVLRYLQFLNTADKEGERT